MQPNGISTHHRYSQPLAFCLTYPYPPYPPQTTSTLSGTIKPRLRWTSSISTLPSTCCPPPHLLLSPLLPSPLSFLPPPPISACHSSISLLIPVLPPPPPPPICFTPPLRSLAPSYQPPPPSPPLAAPVVWLCVGLVLLTGLGRADNAGSWTMGRIL